MTSACLNSRLLPIFVVESRSTAHTSHRRAKETFLIVAVVVNHIRLIRWSIQKFRLSPRDQQMLTNYLIYGQRIRDSLFQMLFMNVSS